MSATFTPRPSCSISFEFTLFGNGRDEAYAAAMAEAIFEFLAQGPTDLVDSEGNEWDYSIDGFNVDEYRSPRVI